MVAGFLPNVANVDVRRELLGIPDGRTRFMPNVDLVSTRLRIYFE